MALEQVLARDKRKIEPAIEHSRSDTTNGPSTGRFNLLEECPQKPDGLISVGRDDPALLDELGAVLVEDEGRGSRNRVATVTNCHGTLSSR